MLEIANEKAKKLGVSDRVEFIEANALHTPFKNETFDIITITWGLRNLSDLQIGVQEIYRMLKRGGRFLSLEFFKHDDGLSKSISSWYISHVIPFIGRIFSASGAYRYLAASREKFITADDFSKMLLKTGFINVSCKHFIFQVNTIHMGEKPR
jgi:demethylmenaquinone methyltransferase/2-methoxy-6-polyprenyl-1,4-benzoquinol methylase